MIVISKQYSFDAAHRLWRDDWAPDKNERVFGKCSREHGHTYNLEVTVGGEINPETGMILNYFDLDKIMKPMVDAILDHYNLNDVFPFLTTAENMVQDLARQVNQALEFYPNVRLEQVVLKETPKTRALWRRS